MDVWTRRLPILSRSARLLEMNPPVPPLVQTINPTFEALNQLVLELNVRWQMFDELYSEAENYEVLNRTGANFWGTLHNTLVDDIMMAISRYLDPAKMGKNDNFSLAAIIALPEVAAFRDDLQKRLDAINLIWSRGVKDWRHKRLSHSDMATTLGNNTLPTVPFTEIKELVDGITSFAREITHQVLHFDQSFRCSITGWVPQVLRYLKLGVEKTDENRLKAYGGKLPTPDPELD
jgi:hypothetical protein